MSMYFASLRATFVIFLMAGALNLANVFFYASDEYDAGEVSGLFGIRLLPMLRFSALCTDREWVVCSEPEGAERCSASPWDTPFSRQYYGVSENEDGDEVVLVNRTKCDIAQVLPGVINYGTLLFFILSMSLFMWYSGRKEVRFDEDRTTPSDYTLVVKNPPPDALDPGEWRDFFEALADGSVTLCTVALDNERLVDKLVQRRRDMQVLKRRLPPCYEVDFFDEQAVEIAVENASRFREGLGPKEPPITLSTGETIQLHPKEAKRSYRPLKLLGRVFGPLMQRLGVGLTESAIWQRIKATTEEIRELQQREYKAVAIYVTFETEQGQRNALGALNASEMEINLNKPMNINSSALFRGCEVLRVAEASEPNAVVREIDASSLLLMDAFIDDILLCYLFRFGYYYHLL